MTRRSLTILISLILIVLGVSAVLLCKFTTLFNGSGLPRGLAYSWYEEGPLRSGEIMPFDRLMLPHVSSMKFLEFKGHRYDKICGRPPFIEKVPNTPLRLFVSLEPPEKKIVHVVNIEKSSITSIPAEDGELQGIGDYAGSSIFPEADEVEVADPSKPLLQWRHQSEYETTAALLDVGAGRIVDVKSSRVPKTK